MTRSFSSPGEYLEYLQGVYEKAYPASIQDAEFAQITITQLDEYGLALSELGQYGGLRLAVEGLKSDLLQSLGTLDRERVVSDVAIGLLADGQANAFIARSPDGKHAIVLCSGFMLLLHKYLKLIRASVTPANVVYCNRKPASELTKMDLHSYIVDLVLIYKALGVPSGPMIKLSDNAMIEHAFVLTLGELFVLCHELGHFLNGDLEDQSAYSALPHNAEGQRFDENRNHEIEHRADVTGFGLYRASLKSRGFDASSIEWLKPIVATFNLLYAIGGGASSTHPHPYDRVRRIVDHHFGLELGAKMSDALNAPDLLPSFWEQKTD